MIRKLRHSLPLKSLVKALQSFLRPLSLEISSMTKLKMNLFMKN